MKIGFIVTAHHSDELRPQGGMFLERFMSSLNESCTYDYHVYIVDNESTYKLPIYEKSTYIRIDNQMLEGITGAWNLGINTAYEDGCTFLINCNDDIWFNDTINVFIDYMLKYMNVNFIYSALSNGILGYCSQKSDGPKQGIQMKPCINADTCVNGFFFGMSKYHYERFRYTKDKYFNKDSPNNGGDGKFGGQEGTFIDNSSKGLLGFIVNECFIPHDKIRGWKQLVNRNK